MNLMKLLFSVVLIFCAAGIFSAPLEYGYSLIPASASTEERTKVFLESRHKVINAAGKYEKTPYRYGGVSRSGLDCSGLIYLSFKDALGVSLPRTTVDLYAWTEKIPYNMAEPGDLLFFKTDNTGKISHVALYVGDNRFIHSASGGPRTGVIYSSLEENYWNRTFAGAGRAFPEINTAAGNAAGVNIVSTDTIVSSVSSGAASSAASTNTAAVTNVTVNAADTMSGNGRLLLGIALAPTWGAFLKDGEIVRGFASQLRLGAETYTFGTKMLFGFEIRPEYDGALGVFRLPFTFSWGPNDKIIIFAGPVLSFGEAVLSTDSGSRYYSSGTSWLGAVGITAAPFILKIASGDFAPYFETAWQAYFSENPEDNLNADFAAGFRFSTGIRYTWQVR
ncbi:MAG: C40 family peptidase [Treponema sp.]|jgi:probable lipoprotein NlpC|nr:C40 family peptidase [Treponema sp.]